MLKDSDIDYDGASFNVEYGFLKYDSKRDNEAYNSYNREFGLKVYDGDYPWLTHDIDRDNDFGYTTHFEWLNK